MLISTDFLINFNSKMVKGISIHTAKSTHHTTSSNCVDVSLEIINTNDNRQTYDTV